MPSSRVTCGAGINCSVDSVLMQVWSDTMGDAESWTTKLSTGEARAERARMANEAKIACLVSMARKPQVGD